MTTAAEHIDELIKLLHEHKKDVRDVLPDEDRTSAYGTPLFVYAVMCKKAPTKRMMYQLAKYDFDIVWDYFLAVDWRECIGVMQHLSIAMNNAAFYLHVLHERDPSLNMLDIIMTARDPSGFGSIFECDWIWKKGHPTAGRIILLHIYRKKKFQSSIELCNECVRVLFDFILRFDPVCDSDKDIGYLVLEQYRRYFNNTAAAQQKQMSVAHYIAIPSGGATWLCSTIERYRIFTINECLDVLAPLLSMDSADYIRKIALADNEPYACGYAANK